MYSKETMNLPSENSILVSFLDLYRFITITLRPSELPKTKSYLRRNLINFKLTR